MEDFFAAGGIGAVLRELKPLLHLDCMTVTGETLGERLADEARLGRPQGHPAARRPDRAAGRARRAVRHPRARRRHPQALRRRRPRCSSTKAARWCSTSLEDLAARIDDPDLDVTPDDILVLQNAGPQSGSGMPEAGYLPIPRKLARAGVKDMVRISDARMSGTAYGTIVLHVTPEAAVGGPLALVRNGDRIALSVANRRSISWWTTRSSRGAGGAPARHRGRLRGYARLYIETVMQADEGCDFDFLRKA